MQTRGRASEVQLLTEHHERLEQPRIDAELLSHRPAARNRRRDA
jgi:hypothetical protein